jgi:hypothetical protein
MLFGFIRCLLIYSQDWRRLAEAEEAGGLALRRERLRLAEMRRLRRPGPPAAFTQPQRFPP